MNTDFADIDKTKPLVLLLGNVDHEGITSPLKALGEQYKKKLLASSEENWRSILKYFDEFKIRAVIIKLNGQVYELLARGEYSVIGPELLDRIGVHRHAAFVYQDLLSGRVDAAGPEAEGNDAQRDDYDREDLEWLRGSYLHRPSAEILGAVNDLLRKHELNLIPYTTNAELTVMATQFLRDSLEQLLFRMYVPSGRLWANEVDRLLQLFRDFLLKTGRKGLRLEPVLSKLEFERRR